MYYKVYENKTADNAVEFLKECKEYFPFYITHILTDNGLEFTDKWARGKGVVSGNHKFDVECSKPQGQLPSEYKIDDVKKDLNKYLIFYNFNVCFKILILEWYNVVKLDNFLLHRTESWHRWGYSS